MNLDLFEVLKSKYGVSDLRHLGNGQFGVVYSGTVHEVPRAIKVSRDVLDLKLLAMADQELAFMRQNAILDCPTIVQLIAVWREHGHLITVWELGEQSLAARLAECKLKGMSGIPIEELKRHLQDAAAGLDVLNGLGIRHRDIKPDNIILVRGRAKITDLGLALFVGASSLSKTASGTMGYIAPEAYGDEEHKHGRLTATVDIYALAATAIKLASGRDPFGTNPRDIIKNQEAGNPDIADLTKPQASAALSALHPDPKQRPFATAAEFVAAFLGNAVRSSPILQPIPNVNSQPPAATRTDVPFVAPAKAFDFDIVASVESSEAQVRTAVAEALRMETACRYGEAADVLDQLERNLRDNSWIQTLRNKQAQVNVLGPQIAEAVRTKQHRWIRPAVEELLALLPHDQKLKQLRDTLPELQNELTHPSGIKLKLILPGEFLMGSTPAEVDRMVRDLKDFKKEYASDEQPQHRVRITQPFYCGITPVTQAQWKAVMGQSNNPSHFKGDDFLPVEQVSWDMTQEFLAKANGNPNSNSVGSLRLLTEAEWEYCCRGGTTTIFSWGDDVRQMSDYAWYDGNSEKKTHPVGQKRPNARGLYDFPGLVWEWCDDVYDAEAYRRRSGTTDDPKETSGSEFRVLRGGSWNGDSRYARSAYRYWDAPDLRYFSYGFRVVLPFSAVRTP